MRVTMEKIGQVAAAAVIAALASAVIKKQAPELALVLVLCGVTGIFLLTVGLFDPIRQLMDTLAEKAALSPAAVAPVIKTVGIGLMSRLAAELCRDAKESGLAAAVEMAGSVLALWVALPLFETVLSDLFALL